MKNPYWLAFVGFAFLTGLAIGALGSMAFRPDKQTAASGEPRPILGPELRAYIEQRAPQFYEVPAKEVEIKVRMAEQFLDGLFRIAYSNAGVPVAPRLLAAQRQSMMQSRMRPPERAKPPPRLGRAKDPSPAEPKPTAE